MADDTNDYGSLMERFCAARSVLMLPHPEGEAHSVALAFRECQTALEDFDERGLDSGDVGDWIGVIKRHIDTAGLEDPAGKGPSHVKAAQMSTEEKSEFSSSVDELADYCQSRYFWTCVRGTDK